jgi:hypothetical protein
VMASPAWPRCSLTVMRGTPRARIGRQHIRQHHARTLAAHGAAASAIPCVKGRQRTPADGTAGP